jgi:hypothetical protein
MVPATIDEQALMLQLARRLREAVVGGTLWKRLVCG